MPSVAAEAAFVVACHDAAHGWKARPLGRKARFDWRDVARRWTRRGALQYSEVRRIAEVLGRDPSRPRDDAALRVEFARRLREAGEHRPTFTEFEIRRGRLRAAIEAIARAEAKALRGR